MGHTKNIYCKSIDCPLRLSSLHAYKLLLRYFEINQELRFFPSVLMYYWMDVSTIYKFPVIMLLLSSFSLSSSLSSPSSSSSLLLLLDNMHDSTISLQSSPFVHNFQTLTLAVSKQRADSQVNSTFFTKVRVNEVAVNSYVVKLPCSSCSQSQLW